MDKDLASARRAPTGGDMNSQMAAMQQQQQKKAQMEEMKKAVLKTLLTPDARARLASVKLVKPGKAASLENYLVQNSKNFRRGVNEKQLKQLLESMGGGVAKVTIKRRAYSDSEEEDDNDDDLL
eukprot:g2246.t1